MLRLKQALLWCVWRCIFIFVRTTVIHQLPKPHSFHLSGEIFKTLDFFLAFDNLIFVTYKIKATVLCDVVYVHLLEAAIIY